MTEQEMRKMDGDYYDVVRAYEQANDLEKGERSGCWIAEGNFQEVFTRHSQEGMFVDLQPGKYYGVFPSSGETADIRKFMEDNCHEEFEYDGQTYTIQ